MWITLHHEKTIVFKLRVYLTTLPSLAMFTPDSQLEVLETNFYIYTSPDQQVGHHGAPRQKAEVIEA